MESIEQLLGQFIVQNLKDKLSPEEFNQIVAKLEEYGKKVQADLSYDMNAAVNAIISKFPGRTKITVSEAHQALRDMGIIDYKPQDMAYIEATLKRFGILLVPE